MNPSSSGWINKLLKDPDVITNLENMSLLEFYKSLRSNGFIYGSNMHIMGDILKKNDLTGDEICKINFLLALKYTHNISENKANFIESVIDFYKDINAHKTTFFYELLGEKKTSNLLENIIHKRIQIDDNIIDRSFNYFITNALLFADVLAYKVYLETNSISKDYIQNLESTIETIALEALNAKVKKSNYDHSLIDLIEQSMRYEDRKKFSYSDALNNIKSPAEAYYIMDIACMATWGDFIIDKKEKQFLDHLGSDLQLDTFAIDAAVHDIDKFFAIHKDKIALLNSKNMVQTFYNNSSKMVNKLISRNGKRLSKELHQSKELMKLLTQAAVRDLNEEEQKKVNTQLLDIFKSIPSLAIFMLPGGALLLPLVIKFIPKLLPSAFDDNRIEE